MESTIIPVASGKGGVGKTLISANIAIALARMGHSTVAVDLDLGGSNLYTYLGVPNKYPGIGDYLKGGVADFQDLVVPTPIPNLSFVPGDGKTPFLANITFEERRALINGIKNIRARYVILDLSAGSTFNTLNFFGIVKRGLCVTSFETPAVMNFVMFLRNFMLRVLSGVVRSDKRVFEMLLSAFGDTARAEIMTVPYLVREISSINPRLAAAVEETCRRYRPAVVFNMGDDPEELAVAGRIESTLKQGLAISPRFFGFVYHDDSVRVAAKKREVLLTRYPSGRASQGIIRLAKKIVSDWDSDAPETAADLMERARSEQGAFRA